MSRIRAAALIFGLAVCAGCALNPRGPVPDPARVETLRAAQQRAALDAWLVDRVRLHRVSVALFTANRAACGDRLRQTPRALLLTTRDFPAPLRGTARQAGYGERPRVVATTRPQPGHGARAVGSGDRIVALMGEALPESRAGRWLAQRLQKAASSPTGTPRVGVVRGAERLEVQLPVVRGCDFRVELTRSDAVNAYATGDAIRVTRGLLRFVQNDDELAFVLAHEMAHNLRHRLPERLLATLSERLAVAAGLLYRAATRGRGEPPAPSTYAQALEAQADYLALDYLESAGYTVTAALDFWQRLGTIHPRSVTPGYVHSHPTSPERIARLEAALRGRALPRQAR